MKLYSSLLDLHDVEAYVRTICDNVGLTIQWGEPDCTPCTDGKRMVLPKFTSKASVDEVIQVVANAIHEGYGHVVHSDFDLFQKTGLSAANSNLGALWNAVEDHRIEWIAAKSYAGDRLYLEESMRIYADKSAQRAKEAVAKMGSIPVPIAKYIGPAINWEQTHRSELFGHGGLWGGKTLRENKDYQKFRPRYDEHPVLVRMLKEAREITDPKKGTKATLDLACKIWELVYKGDPEKEKEEAKKRAEEAEKKRKEAEARGEGKGEGSDGEEGEGEGKDKGKGKPGGEGEGEGDDDPSKDKTESILTVKWKEAYGRSHDKPNLTGKGQHLDYSTYHRGYEYQPATIGEVEVVDYSKRRKRRV